MCLLKDLKITYLNTMTVSKYLQLKKNVNVLILTKNINKKCLTCILFYLSLSFNIYNSSWSC
jgi:hypothetical protein